MKPAIFLSLLILAAAPSGAKEKPVKTAPSEIDSLLRYSLPDGWSVERKAAATDPSIRADDGNDIIKIRLYGGKGSRYAAPENFIEGFEAMTMGRPPESKGEMKVAGRVATVYSHGYPIELGDPHAVGGAPPKMAREQFLILPAGRRFVVLSYARETSIPDPARAGEKAWAAFLKSIALAR